MKKTVCWWEHSVPGVGRAEGLREPDSGFFLPFPSVYFEIAKIYSNGYPTLWHTFA